MAPAPLARLRRLALPLVAAVWGGSALLHLGLLLAGPSRGVLASAVGVAAGFALAALAWHAARGGVPGRWGALPLAVLALAPLPYAAWWNAPLVALLAVPPALLLLREPVHRGPLLPAARDRAAVVVVLAYLALAPPLDGLLLGPPAPPAVALDAPGFTVVAEEERRLAGGEGVLRAQRLRASEGPEVELVRVAFPPGGNLSRALRESYAPGAEGAWNPLFLFAMMFHVEERRATEAALPEGWSRVEVVNNSLYLFFLLPIPSEEGERQVFLLRPLGTEVRPSLLPPFGQGWTTWAGYRLLEAGDNAAMLRRLDGNVTVGGALLDLPAPAFEGLAVGPYRTPGPEAALVLAAVGAAALLARRRGARAGNR